jgi:dTDP-4-dehydrorhamnose reductase
VVLISTDNVFDGVAPVNDEAAPPRPANIYGASKLAAERIVLGLVPDATVLRVSLVYGWAAAGTTSWLNFFAACADRLGRGERVTAPYDTWTTPVLVDDAAAVTAAVVRGPTPRLLHLGGPDRISRARWAAMLAEELGAPAELVVPAPRAETRYACRPVNSCLSSSLLAGTLMGTGLRIRGVREGTRELLSRPATQNGPVP